MKDLFCFSALSYYTPFFTYHHHSITIETYWESSNRYECIVNVFICHRSHSTSQILSCFVGDFMSLTHYMAYHHQPPVFSRERQKPTFCYHIRVANSVVWHYLTVMSLVADVNAMMCRCCVQKCAAHITADS